MCSRGLVDRMPLRMRLFVISDIERSDSNEEPKELCEEGPNDASQGIDAGKLAEKDEGDQGLPAVTALPNIPSGLGAGRKEDSYEPVSVQWPEGHQIEKEEAEIDQNAPSQQSVQKSWVP